MATFFFDDMTADQALGYNPTFDRILFTGVSAAQVSVTFVPFTATTPDFLILTSPTKSLTFNDPGGFRGETDAVFRTARCCSPAPGRRPSRHGPRRQPYGARATTS